MEKIIPTEKLGATLLWPITGLATGTPVLIRKLTAPQRERRAEAAALRAKREELAAEAAEAAEAAFVKKVSAETDPIKRAAMLQAQEAAKVAAREFELEQAKAARKETRSKLGDTAGAAALLLVVGGPLIWSLARPWIQPGIGILLGVWWIAALIHAPAPAKTRAKDAAPADADDDQGDADDDREQTEPTDRPPLTVAELTTTIEHMVAIRAQRDEGRGYVHLAEVLESLQRHHYYPGLTARDFGAVVRAAGLPVEPKIRVAGKKEKAVSPGFSAEGLTALLGRPPQLPAQPVPEPAPAEAV
ncbi:hypothetical protein [Kitasatospora sp. NPDC051705]|uniref:hypothetical protein n=1 Tax=Kitasatospora sp. NPDC051705 TaxID=3364057 RepID=UPI0037A7660A